MLARATGRSSALWAFLLTVPFVLGGCGSATKTQALGNAKDISRFTILAVDGSITDRSIALTFPHGTDLTKLTPSIEITGLRVSPASGVAQDFTRAVGYTVTAADGSTRSYVVTVSAAASAAKDITAFSVGGIAGTIGADTITLTLPNGADLTSLAPTITHEGASVAPPSNVAQDFRNSVEYTVTAADGSTKSYTARVTGAASTAKSITAFSILGIAGTVGANTITLTVPYGTSATSLTPTITYEGVSLSPASDVAQDFTNAVAYTVTAADRSSKTYAVTVSIAPSGAKNITAFSILGIPGTVGASTVALTVPYGTGVTSLVPTVTHEGAGVAPTSGLAQDFTAPVAYTVTAADASTKSYVVTVAVALSSAKNIIAFSTLGIPGTVGVNTVVVTVPHGTDVSRLVPTIIREGASVSPASGAAQDFTSPVAYRVTAADGSTKTYAVTVTAAASAAKNIATFSILGIAGTVGASTITLTVPFGKNVMSLMPTITLEGARVSPNSGVAQ
jgi:hypothetical protein